MRAIEKIWWRRDEPWWAEFVFWPLSISSLVFRAGAALRMRTARPHRARAKVISVGNLAAGGAGKTPVAMLLCEQLRARGKRPALLSRGYGRTSREEITVVCAGDGPLVDRANFRPASSGAASPAELAGDEPLLVARRCPWLTVLVGSDRARLAEKAESMGADVLVLDDGLQQRALASDLDVIVIDKQNPLGNARRIPRGPLREGLEALARTGSRGLLWLSNARGEIASEENSDGELRAVLEAAAAAKLRGPVESAAVAKIFDRSIVGTPTFLLAGIARPERFEETARASGIEVCGAAFFADHHPFTAADLRRVRKAALGAGARAILTTEKDAARLAKTDLEGEPRIESLPIDLEILAGTDQLGAALDAVLA